MKQNLTDDALVRAVPMQAYREWDAFDSWHALNVTGMARWLAAN